MKAVIPQAIPRTLVLCLGVFSAARALALIAFATTIGTAFGVYADSDIFDAGLLTELGDILLPWGALSVVFMAVLSSGEDLYLKHASRSIESAVRARATAFGLAEEKSATLEQALSVTVQLEKIAEFITGYLPALTRTLVLIPILGCYILLQDWLSALILAVTLPLVPLFMVLIGQHTRENTQAAIAEMNRLSYHVAELARGLATLVGLGRAQEQSRALQEIDQRYQERTMTTLRLAFLSALALELIATISVALIAVSLGLRLISGSITLSIALTILILAPECFAPLRMLGSAFHSSQEGLAALETAEKIPGKQQNSQQNSQQGDFTQYWSQHWDRPYAQLLQNISAQPAGVIGLVGRSGTGKTSLLERFAREHADDSQKLALVYVQQQPQFYAEIVEHELAATGISESEQTVLLDTCELAAAAQQHIATLSPGQRRRLAVARAAAHILRWQHSAASARLVLLLDEPTAHLDQQRAAQVRDWISTLPDSVTVVLASHDSQLHSLITTCIPMTDTVEAPGSEWAGHSTASTASPASPTSTASTAAHRQAASTATPASEHPAPYAPIPDVAQAPWPRRLARLLQGQVLPMLGALGLAVAASAAGIALSALSGWLIVRASEQPPVMLLLVAIVGVRFFGLARSILRYAERLLVHKVAMTLTGRWRAQLWQHLSTNALILKPRLEAGPAVSTVVVRLDQLRDALIRSALPLGTALVLIPAAAWLCWYLVPNTELVLVLSGGALLALMVPVVAASAVHTRTLRAHLASRSTLFEHTERALSMAGFFRVHAQTGTVEAWLQELDDHLTGTGRANRWVLALSQGWIWLILWGSALLLLITGVKAGVDPGVLLALVLMQVALVEPVSSAVQAVPAAAHTLILSNIVPATPKLTSQSETDPAQQVAQQGLDSVELDQISAAWTPDKPVVHKLNLEIRRGRWSNIVGESGTGKTTILAVAMGFLPPSAGQILINQRPRSIQPGELAPRLAWCPQESHIFDSTIRGNLALASSTAHSDELLWEALNRVGLSEQLLEHGKDLDSPCGPAGSQLSGGQRQRLAMARTLLAGADLLCLDEPAAHLDEQAAASLYQDVRALTGTGRLGVLHITHQRQHLEASDATVDLDRHQGRY